jgi:hypothetical protein
MYELGKKAKGDQPKVHVQPAATRSHFRSADLADDCGFTQILE